MEQSGNYSPVSLARKSEWAVGAINSDISRLEILQIRGKMIRYCLVVVGEFWRQEESVDGQRKPRRHESRAEHDPSRSGNIADERLRNRIVQVLAMM